jgi:hypothetical protein
VVAAVLVVVMVRGDQTELRAGERDDMQGAKVVYQKHINHLDFRWMYSIYFLFIFCKYKVYHD